MSNSGFDFTKVIDLSRELLCIHEPDGTYKYINQRIKSLAGYEASELIGKNPYQFFHPDDLEEITRTHESSWAEESPTLEYRFKTKSGSYIWLQTEAKVIKNDEGEIVELFTSSHDITELKELIGQNQKSQELLQHAAKMANVGAWEVNLETMTPHWDRTTLEIHEVDPNFQPDLETAINFFAEEVRDFVTEHVDNAIKNHQEFDFVLPLITAKGNRKWVRSIAHPKTKAGKTVRLYGVAQDVTKETLHNLKLNEMAAVLRQQKEQLQDFNQVISHNLRGPLTNLNLIKSLISDNGSYLEDKVKDGLFDAITKLNQLITDFQEASNLPEQKNTSSKEVNIEKVFEKVKGELADIFRERDAKLSTNFSAWQSINYPEQNLRFYLHQLLSNACKFASPKRPLVIEITTTIQNGHRHLCIKDNGIGIDTDRYGEKMFKLYKTFHKGYDGRGHGLFSIRNQVNALGGEIFVESEVGNGTKFILDLDYLDINAEFEEKIKKVKGLNEQFESVRLGRI